MTCLRSPSRTVWKPGGSDQRPCSAPHCSPGEWAAPQSPSLQLPGPGHGASRHLSLGSDSTHWSRRGGLSHWTGVKLQSSCEGSRDCLFTSQVGKTRPRDEKRDTYKEDSSTPSTRTMAYVKFIHQKKKKKKMTEGYSVQGPGLLVCTASGSYF